eukprot:2206142-Rhodomonas_salina.1
MEGGNAVAVLVVRVTVALFDQKPHRFAVSVEGRPVDRCQRTLCVPVGQYWALLETVPGTP